ncbi:MAG: DUF3352 domain-containing protein, partial [Cyanobacteria bacterium J06632_3]
MSAAQPFEPKSLVGRGFFVGLSAFALTLVLLGVGAFAYLQAQSPLALLSGSDRAIAAATTLVPASSPFSVSLLTRPEKLLAVQQALSSADQRQIARDEFSQLKQTLLDTTGLDYDRDLLPWMGEEITFSVISADLDADKRNGQQPGYLLAIEIAPERDQQAQEFLQLFWQQQALAGRPPQSQQISGARVLFASPAGRQDLTAATALLGNQFVLFANDVQVLRRSIRSAQTAQNLAQNRGYRQAVEQLPKSRVALAYVNQAYLDQSYFAPLERSQYAAVGMGVTRAGLVVNAHLFPAEAISAKGMSGQERFDRRNAPSAVTTDVLGYVPAGSSFALVSQDVSRLETVLPESRFPAGILPDFLQLRSTDEKAQTASSFLSPSLWSWLKDDYALARIGRDWILVTKQNQDDIEGLDQAAQSMGYSVVPVDIGDRSATAWTRFKVRSGRAAANRLETELMGLHVQMEDYELFTSSLSAMDSALSAPERSLQAAERFTNAIAPLPSSQAGYIYFDWDGLTPILSKAFPAFSLFQSTARPLLAHIDTVAATQTDKLVTLFVQLKESRTFSRSAPQATR